MAIYHDIIRKFILYHRLEFFLYYSPELSTPMNKTSPKHYGPVLQIAPACGSCQGKNKPQGIADFLLRTRGKAECTNLTSTADMKLRK